MTTGLEDNAEERELFSGSKSYNRDLAVFVIAVPRNLRRLCIIDENDDDDYKHIIAQAKRLGPVIIAVVGPPPTPRGPGGHPPQQPIVNGLYDQSLERLFEIQPKLRPFKQKGLFFSFVEFLNEVQIAQFLSILKPHNIKSLKPDDLNCTIL
jgi:hypothetical protein